MAETARRWLGRVGSVRVRVTLVASLVTAVAVTLAGWLLIRSVEDTQLNRIRHDAEQSLDTAAERLEAGSRPDEALADLPSTVFITDKDRLCVVSNPPDGGTLTQCDSQVGSTDPELEPANAPLPGPGVTGDGNAKVMVASDADVKTRTVDSPLFGELTLSAVVPSNRAARGAASVANALWVLVPSLVGVVALVAWWLAGRALRPVEAIRVEAEAIGGATMHRRLPEPVSDDEIGRLARTMNAMLDRLEQSAQRQRQFVSDASHELRSPVAAIRTDLEVALHEGDNADWPTVALAVLSEEHRLEALLGDLLVLASDDELAAGATHLGTVDLAQLATDEAARGRRIPVTVDRPPGTDPDSFVVAGVASRLERTLANLLDNADRHASSEIRVTVSRHASRVRLVIDDDGPGIPAADRERIFERFTRLDDGRARQRGGAGLGLAVVRSIVTRHRGHVWADQSPLGGARFTIELPPAGG